MTATAGVAMPSRCALERSVAKDEPLDLGGKPERCLVGTTLAESSSHASQAPRHAA